LFNILAIDHRDSIRVVIDPDAPEIVPGQLITDIKLSIVRKIAPYATAVMLDPVYSAAQAIATGSLPGNVGFLSALEEQGYLGNPLERETTLLGGWSVEKAKRLGAAGIKLLIFYHPHAGKAAACQESLARRVLADCARAEIPLFLEPMFYSFDPHTTVDSPQFAEERPTLVMETVRRLSALEPHILKVPFPCDAKYDSDVARWKSACAALNDVCTVPWALLSGGDPFDVFKQQLQVACENGCSGFMAGRALWREAVSLHGDERDAFLASVLLDRFRELTEITSRFGQSWMRRYRMPVIDETWYSTY
jgi:tagatose 1,6-diphosphate aldolase